MSYFFNAFTDISLGVFVNHGVLIKSPEILDDLESSILFGYYKDQTVEFTSGWLNYPLFQPFVNMLFYFIMMGIWDLELLDVYPFLGPEVHLVHMGVSLTHIILVGAEGFMMFEY